MTDATQDESLTASQIVYRKGHHTKVNIAIIGHSSVGLDAIVHRQLCPNIGPNYDPAYDSCDNAEHDEPPFFVKGEAVAVKWLKLGPGSMSFPKRGHQNESQIQYAGTLIRESDACVLVYSCSGRQSFEQLTWVWDELYLEQQRLNPDVPLCKHICVVSNKIEELRSDWTTPLLEGDAFSSSIGAAFRYMSGRNGEGTQGLGREVAARVLATNEE